MIEVSIVLPVYNSENYIKRTINSILDQSFENWELIVVDDYSNDNSIKIIEELKNEKFTIIKNDKNLGPAISRNKAIDIAKGRYVAFIDSDDVWEKDKLEKQLKFMKKGNIAFSFSSYLRISEKGNTKTKVEVPSKIGYKDLLANTIILTSTVILDVEKINKELIHMPNIRITEDIAMFLNILKNGFIAYGLNECLIKYSTRKRSLSSNKVKSMLSLWNVYKNRKK